MKDKLFKILYNITKNRLLVNIISCDVFGEDLFGTTHCLEFIYDDNQYVIKLTDEQNDYSIQYAYNQYPLLKESLNKDEYDTFQDLFNTIVSNLNQYSESTLNLLHSLCI